MNKCKCDCKHPKQHYTCEEGYVWNPDTCSVKMVNI